MKKPGKLKLLLMLVIALPFAIQVSACNNNQKPTNPVYAVSLSHSALSIAMLETTKITATVTRDGSVVSSLRAEFQSKDENIADIDGDGVITANRKGTTTVTAKYEGVEAVCTLIVTDALKIPSLTLGFAEDITANVLLGGTLELNPAVMYSSKTYADGSFTYSSSQDSVASVNAEGVITGVSKGTADITVLGEWRGFDGGSLNKVLRINVTPNLSVEILPPSSTDISTSNIEIFGTSFVNSVSLDVEVYIGGILTTPASGELSWNSDNEAVAEVSDGVVTAVSAGEARITAILLSEGEYYSSEPIKINVNFPVLDMTATKSFVDVETTVVQSSGYNLLLEGVLSSPEGIIGIRDVAGEFDIGYELSGSNAVINEQALRTGSRVWEVRTVDYAVRVSVGVVTKIIIDTTDLNNIFDYSKNYNKDEIYGPDTLYVLNNYIDATGYTHPTDNPPTGTDHKERGFRGTLDGRGWHINGITLQRNGLFGYLSAGSDIKNLGLTNVIMYNPSGKANVMAITVYPGANIDNLFISVQKADTSEKLIFSTLFNGSTDTAKVSNVVIFDATHKAGAPWGSFTVKFTGGNLVVLENVHVISDTTLFYLDVAAANPKATDDGYNGAVLTRSQITRYGEGGHYNSLSDRYPDMSNANPIAGFDAGIWDFEGEYPSLKTYKNKQNDYISSGLAAIEGEVEFEYLTGGEFSVPATLGAVNLSFVDEQGDALLPNDYPNGVIIDGAEVIVADNAWPSEFFIKIVSAITGEYKIVSFGILDEIAEEFGKLPDTLTQNKGETKDFSIPSKAGEVSLSILETEHTGVVISGRTITMSADSYEEYSLTVSSVIYPALTKEITLIVGERAVTVDQTTIDLSQDAGYAGNNNHSLSHAKIEGATIAKVSYTKTTVGEETGVPVELDVSDYSVDGNKLVITRNKLSGLATGEYTFLVYSGEDIIRFEKVFVVTNILTHISELKPAFNYGTGTAARVYGVGTYYVLGGNLAGGGAQHYAVVNNVSPLDRAVNAGFDGIFDGRGYTIDSYSLGLRGLFGYIGFNAQIRNIALTNITFFGRAGTADRFAVLAGRIGAGAVIENLFVSVKTLGTGATDSNDQINLLGIIGAHNGTIQATLKDIVVHTDFVATTGTVTSLMEKIENGNNLKLQNVHVISDYYLFNNGTGNPAGLTDRGNNYTVSGVNRYGANAAVYANFEERYAAGTAVAEMGLDSCWVYDTQVRRFPVFVTAVQYLTT